MRFPHIFKSPNSQKAVKIAYLQAFRPQGKAFNLDFVQLKFYIPEVKYLRHSYKTEKSSIFLFARSFLFLFCRSK